MQHIQSSIDIDAPAALVWAILTDFAAYKRWNPVIRAILGTPGNGNALRMSLQRNGRPLLSMNSTLTYLCEPSELRWRHRRSVAGLFATEHRFRIESLSAGGVRFHQTERIEGLFASLLGRGRRRTTEEDFHAMNHALKARAERMGARLPGRDREPGETPRL
jgi:hypothetical protein